MRSSAAARCAIVLLTLNASAFAADLFHDVAAIKLELRSSSPLRRRSAVERLEAYSPNAVQPILESALGDADSEVRAAAAKAIGRLDLVALAPKLEPLLENGDQKLRVIVVEALGRLAKGDSVPASVLRATSDGEPSVRIAALEVMGRAHQKLSNAELETVERRLDDEHPNVRKAAAAVLGLVGKRGAKQMVLPLLARLADGSREVRMESLDAIGALEDEHAAPSVARLLKDSAIEVRRLAARTLGRLRADSAAPLLIEAAAADSDVADEALVALGRIANRKSSPLIIATILNAFMEIDHRRAAFEAALAAGGPIMAEPIATRLKTTLPEDETRRVLLSCESLLGAEAALDPLVDALQIAPDPALVKAIGASLRATDSASPRFARAQSALIELSGRPDPALRDAAIFALSEHPDRRAIPSLVRAINSAAGRPLEAALETLAKLRAHAAATELVALTARSKSLDRQSAIALIEALSTTEDPIAFRSIVILIEHPDRSVRLHAAVALGRLAFSPGERGSLLSDLFERARALPIDRRADSLTAIGLVVSGDGPSASLPPSLLDPVRKFLLTQAEGPEPTCAVAAFTTLARSPLGVNADRLKQILYGRTKQPQVRSAMEAVLAHLHQPLTFSEDFDSSPLP